MSEAWGMPLTFRRFLRYGLPVTLLTIGIATVELTLRWLVLASP